MIQNNKKMLLRLSLLVGLLAWWFCAWWMALAAAAAFAYLAYLNTQTPYGRLDLRAALSLNLLEFGIRFRPDKGMAFQQPVRLNLLYPLSMALPNEPVHKTEDIHISGAEGDIPARVYWPNVTANLAGELPVVVYFHGGGFTLGNLDQFDDQCRSLANAGKTIVVSVDYRLAPRFPFPAAIDDGYAAVRWVAEHAAQLGADANKLVVAGDSAGGGISAVVALRALRESGPRIAAQILYYPLTDFRLVLSDSQHVTQTESQQGSANHSMLNFSDGYGLTRDMMTAFREAYAGQVEDLAHPDLSPLLAPSHAGLPPTLVVTAGFDPLHDSGVQYVKKLREAQVPVTWLDYKDTVHGFLSIRFFRQRRQALNETARFLNHLFHTQP